MRPCFCPIERSTTACPECNRPINCNLCTHNKAEYIAPLIPQSEILRIGMSGGRALIETTKAKPRKDTRTLDLFDTELTLF